MELFRKRYKKWHELTLEQKVNELKRRQEEPYLSFSLFYFGFVFLLIGLVAYYIPELMTASAGIITGAMWLFFIYLVDVILFAARMSLWKKKWKPFVDSFKTKEKVKY